MRRTSVKTILNKIDCGMTVIEKTIMLVMGVALFVLMTWCVLGRYCFSLSCPYQTELAQTFHIWLCFMGSSYLFAVNENSNVDIFPGRVMASKNMLFKKIYFTIIYLTDFIFVIPCVQYGIINIPMYAAQKTVYYGYSYIFIYGAAVLGFIMISLRIILCILDIWTGGYFEKYDPAMKAAGENGGAEA